MLKVVLFCVPPPSPVLPFSSLPFPSLFFLSFSFLSFSYKTSWHRAAGIPSTPGRPLIDFSKELPPPAALAVPAGGHGGPGSLQPQSIKLALEASDMMLANKERDANKVGSAGSAFALWLLLCTGCWYTMSVVRWPCTTA